MTFFAVSASFTMLVAMPFPLSILRICGDGHYPAYILANAIHKNSRVKPARMQLDLLGDEYFLSGFEGKNCPCQRIGCLFWEKNTGNSRGNIGFSFAERRI